MLCCCLRSSSSTSNRAGSPARSAPTYRRPKENDMTDETVSIYGVIRNPTSALFNPGAELELGLDPHGAQQTADIHGKWFSANYRGKIFSANVTAATVPVIASGLVSVFTLY